MWFFRSQSGSPPTKAAQLDQKAPKIAQKPSLSAFMGDTAAPKLARNVKNNPKISLSALMGPLAVKFKGLR